MATYQLSRIRTDRTEIAWKNHADLGSAVLLHNARSFINVRWMVIALFAVLGLAALFLHNLLATLGLNVSTTWPWVFAVALTVVNILFYLCVKRLRTPPAEHVVTANIWVQIGVDLLFVTALVHQVGSVDTFIAFTYLFHIVLACIFFSPKHSLLVTLLAAALYLACVLLEVTGLWPAQTILTAHQTGQPARPLPALVLAGSAVCVWFVVWSLASSLSQAVRQRDHQLAVANAQLRKADEEKTQQVIRTTHDLKAPFAGIDSNVQILLHKHGHELDPDARDIIARIQRRAQTLSNRIKDILTLGKIRSPAEHRPHTLTDLAALLARVVDELREEARARRVQINLSVPPMSVHTDTEQLAVLFSNLVANAVLYSRPDSCVDVTGVTDKNGSAHITVQDRGIGIQSDALPHIFEEYFRTKEATRFNDQSTGLGLAIVGAVARNLGLNVKVDSEYEKGTIFTVSIPNKPETERKGD